MVEQSRNQKAKRKKKREKAVVLNFEWLLFDGKREMGEARNFEFGCLLFNEARFVETQ
jgi:hypothetical protein